MVLHVRTIKKQSTAAERKAQAHAACQRGHHTMTPTFRPGEQVCTICGLVTFCPGCLAQSHLPASQAKRAYPLECEQHRNVEVRS